MPAAVSHRFMLYPLFAEVLQDRLEVGHVHHEVDLHDAVQTFIRLTHCMCIK